ncbi:MAG: ABC transporter permease [Gemmatimonadales bacterium]|nr:MAG: ABC transporter permease [Gemmatimonadales bacterium]
MTDRGFWLRIGWRNLGRHRRRSVITAVALAWGFAAVVLFNGILEGMGSDFIRSGTDLMVGQLRVQNPEYEPERELWDVVGGDAGVPLAALLDRVRTDPEVVGAAPRLYGAGIIASDSTSRGGLLMGIRPHEERSVTYFLDGIVEGSVPAAGAYEVLLGQELARQLRTGIGEEVVLVAPAADGSLGNELFTVSGIVRTGIPEVDAAQVILELDDLQFLLALGPDDVHEVVLALRNPWDAPEVAGRLTAGLAELGPGIQVEPWTRFRPELVEFANLIGGMNWVILLVIFLMAAFGVANTMLMGTFERRREFAVVKALGMKPLRIMAMVVGEALVLGLLAVAAGAVIALPLVLWLIHFPLDLTPIAGEQMFLDGLFRFVLRVEHSWSIPIRAAVGLILTATLAAVYPALRAVRIPAAEALAGR